METDKIYLGNNIDILKTFEDNSIDSVVTDPPYGISFMGKKWDYDVPSVALWQEVLRVLKPGGHALVACGTRTQHRMAVNLEDAGFEIRDIVAWVYASGFPKALDIEKQLKKELNKLEKCGIMGVGDSNGNEWNISNKQKTKYYLRLVRSKYLPQKKHIRKEQWEVLQSVLSQQSAYKTMLWKERKKINENGKEPCLEGWSYIQTFEGKLLWCKICESTTRLFENVKKRRLHYGTSFSDGESNGKNTEKNGSGTSYRPQSVEQRYNQFNDISIECRTQKIRETIERFKGYKTSLKPAMELWTLCRKPLKSTVAENVLQWGVGGINVDGCRVGEEVMIQEAGEAKSIGKYGDKAWNEKTSIGRFPANFIHDGSDEVVSLFPETTSGKMNSNHTRHTNGSPNGIYGAFDIEHPLKETIGDSGSAARFFYTAKASQSERNDGLNNFDFTTDKSKGNGLDRVCEYCGTSQLKPQECKCETKSWITKPKKNIHPTVKPVELMTYLCRMITPKNGIVLDPFAGSGSTLIAAKQEKFQYVGIEIDEQYHKIAEARVKAAIVQYSLFD